MARQQTARQVALNSILAKAKELGFADLTEVEWTDIVNEAWASQSVIDNAGRKQFRDKLRETLEGAVARKAADLK